MYLLKNIEDCVRYCITVLTDNTKTYIAIVIIIHIRYYVNTDIDKRKLMFYNEFIEEKGM